MGAFSPSGVEPSSWGATPVDASRVMEDKGPESKPWLCEALQGPQMGLMLCLLGCVP